MGAIYIYSLADPETGRVRYIGKAKDVYLRVRGHMRDCQSGKTPVKLWVRELLARGLWPTPTIIEVTDEAGWEEAEKRLISQYRKSHDDLLNVADGGNPGFKGRGICRSGGKAAVLARTATPEARRLYEWKRDVGNAIRWLRSGNPEGYERFLDYFRPIIRQYPEHCTAWLHLL